MKLYKVNILIRATWGNDFLWGTVDPRYNDESSWEDEIDTHLHYMYIEKQKSQPQQNGILNF